MIRLLPLLLMLAGTVSAQPLRQIPNATLSQWTQAEPTGWQTNNVYDDQGKLQQALVIPAGTSGARLLAKRVVFRTEQPVIAARYGGELSSTLIPYMPAGGKPVTLTVRYRFRPDSADVLRAEVLLDTRDNLPRSDKPDPACICQFNGINGPVTLSPDATSVTFQATFANPASPDLVPGGCSLYVWKIRFWLENKTTHLHEATEAIIEQIALQP